ncbi:MAG: type III pantothenate kinase [bacterium]
MKLVVDVGNTHTVLGLIQDNELVKRRRVETRTGATADELWHFWKMVIDEPLSSGIELLTASVVPDLTTEIERLGDRYLSGTPWILQPPWDETDISVETENPHSVGSDRIAGAAQLFAEFGGGFILDFGTATTIDVVSDSGTYEGGVIYPGIEASSIGLSTEAAKLPRISPEEPEAFTYSSTRSGLKSGLFYGTAGAVERLLEELQQTVDFNGDPAVVATGGGAQSFTQFTDVITHVRPNLVLNGLLRCYPSR